MAGAHGGMDVIDEIQGLRADEAVEEPLGKRFRFCQVAHQASRPWIGELQRRNRLQPVSAESAEIAILVDLQAVATNGFGMAPNKSFDVISVYRGAPMVAEGRVKWGCASQIVRAKSKCPLQQPTAQAGSGMENRRALAGHMKSSECRGHRASIQIHRRWRRHIRRWRRHIMMAHRDAKYGSELQKCLSTNGDQTGARVRCVGPRHRAPPLPSPQVVPSQTRRRSHCR